MSIAQLISRTRPGGSYLDFSEFLGVYGTNGKSKSDGNKGMTEMILKRTSSNLVSAGCGQEENEMFR
jgi:hypothetical protein